MGWVGCSRGVRLQVAFVENLISARRTSLLSQSRLLGAYHVIPLLVSAQAVPDKSLTGSMLQYPLVKLSNMKEVYYIKRRLVQCLINLIVILETSKERVWFPRKHIRINSALVQYRFPTSYTIAGHDISSNITIKIRLIMCRLNYCRRWVLCSLFLVVGTRVIN